MRSTAVARRADSRRVGCFARASRRRGSHSNQTQYLITEVISLDRSTQGQGTSRTPEMRIQKRAKVAGIGAQGVGIGAQRGRDSGRREVGFGAQGVGCGSFPPPSGRGAAISRAGCRGWRGSDGPARCPRTAETGGSGGQRHVSGGVGDGQRPDSAVGSVARARFDPSPCPPSPFGRCDCSGQRVRGALVPDSGLNPALGTRPQPPSRGESGSVEGQDGRGPPPAARCAVARWAARTGRQGVGRRENPPRGTPAAAVLHRAHPCALSKTGGVVYAQWVPSRSPVPGSRAVGPIRSPVPPEGSRCRCGRRGQPSPRGG